jgi:hypothetical protein
MEQSRIKEQIRASSSLMPPRIWLSRSEGNFWLGAGAGMEILLEAGKHPFLGVWK